MKNNHGDALVHLEFFPDRDSAQQALVALGERAPHALLWAGTNPIGFRTSYDVSFVEIYRADGLHPQYIEGDGAKQLTCLRSYADRLNAIGEIGLDYREGMPSREIQLDCFKAQIELALELDRPVCLHVVKAHHDALKVFASTGIPRGFVHGFRKGQDLADEYLKRGLSLSFGAPLMQSEALQTIAKTMPLHRLLLESDTPHPPPMTPGLGGTIELSKFVAELRQRATSTESANEVTGQGMTEQLARNLTDLVCLTV